MEKIVTTCAVIGVILLAIVAFGSHQQFGDAVNGYPFSKSTQGQVLLTSGTSTVVVLGNSARTYERFCNKDTAATEYLSFGNTATITAGTILTAGTCYQMSGSDSMFVGQVNATTASTATTTLLYITNP